MFWRYFFNPQLVHKVLNLKLLEAMLFCYISYWRFWYEVFSVGWLSAQLGGKPEIWMGSFLVSQGPRIPPDNTACWARELGIVSVVSCCALSCSCLVTQAYFIPLFVLFYLLKRNSEDCWREHMLLGVIDFSWLNVQHCSFLLVLCLAKLYLTSFIVHTRITRLLAVIVPMLSEAKILLGIRGL